MGNSFLPTTFCAGWTWLARGRGEDSCGAVASDHGSGVSISLLRWALVGPSTQGNTHDNREHLLQQTAGVAARLKPRPFHFTSARLKGAISCKRFRGILRNL